MKKVLQILSVAALLSLPFSVDAKTRIPVNFMPDEVATVVTDKSTMDITRNREMNYDVMPMRNDAAIAEVASYIGLDEDGRTSDGIKLGFEIEGAEILRITKDRCESVVLVKAVEDKETHVATYGRWAVGQFSGYLWKYDVVMDSYKAEPAGVLPIKGDIFNTALNNKAFAVIYDCNAYEAWANNPIEEIDMTVYGTGRDHWSTPGAEDVLIFPTNGDIKISYTSGFWDVDRNVFAPQSTMFSTNLKKGQCVRVWFEGAEGMPHQAIVVESSKGKAIYPLGYNGKGGTRDPHYLIP